MQNCQPQVEAIILIQSEVAINSLHQGKGNISLKYLCLRCAEIIILFLTHAHNLRWHFSFGTVVDHGCSVDQLRCHFSACVFLKANIVRGERNAVRRLQLSCGIMFCVMHFQENSKLLDLVLFIFICSLNLQRFSILPWLLFWGLAKLRAVMLQYVYVCRGCMTTLPGSD